MLCISPRQSTSVGAPVIIGRHLPFGEWRTKLTADLTDRGYTSHKHTNTSGDDINLIYMNARYYVLDIARFASADSIILNLANPQSYNRYSYVRNNPLNLVDPTGHVVCGLLGERVLDWQPTTDHQTQMHPAGANS